ncbi:cutinase [Elsinoe ampelina]|uniref:Cutinase n=1 Tax=Elsinoe ampelina TaxID=302913 RepID=A0A6A6GGJ2_9PEZI|nr:cutinase [Elsinoe ampelina]
MKFFSLALLTGLAVAAPADLVKRQTGINANELNGACREVTFIFARGSTEAGNMGTIIGPPVSDGLKRRFSTATQGVDYPARLATNFGLNNADPTGVRDMQSKLRSIAGRCPNTKIVVGGYSQGAAITHQALETLDSATRNMIVGAVTFGDTRNLQDGGRIPNYPPSQTRIFCNISDTVCFGTLIITAGHLTYGTDADAAVRFLAGLIERA